MPLLAGPGVVPGLTLSGYRLSVMSDTVTLPQDEPRAEALLLNIANALTVLRLLLVPVFVWLVLQPGEGMRLAATVVFVVASVTDQLDGYLTRSLNLVTSFGKITDPIADKALTLSAFVLLSVDGRL